MDAESWIPVLKGPVNPASLGGFYLHFSNASGACPPGWRRAEYGTVPLLPRPRHSPSTSSSPGCRLVSEKRELENSWAGCARRAGEGGARQGGGALPAGSCAAWKLGCGRRAQPRAPGVRRRSQDAAAWPGGRGGGRPAGPGLWLQSGHSTPLFSPCSSKGEGVGGGACVRG